MLPVAIQKGIHCVAHTQRRMADLGGMDPQPAHLYFICRTADTGVR